MEGSGVHAVELVFLLLLLFVVAFATLARRLQLPYPIVLVIAGLLLSFMPGIPKVTMNPDLIFLVVLPPLLYSAAWFTSWRDFSYNIVSILLLAFGLVCFTVLGVAQTAHWTFGGFDWRLGFVLGAVVATTDAIAAISIFKRIGIPQRIVDVLEGESLVNDATGLLALEFGVAMMVQGQTPSPAAGVLRLTYLMGAGIAVGLVTALIVERLHRYLDDGPIEITLSVMVPYAAYLAAWAVNASAVFAVLACGLYLSRRSTHLFSPSVRLQLYGFWDSLTFVLNGFVFVLIGLQLPFVLAGIREYKLGRLLLFGGLFSALVIGLRLVWVFPGAYVANVIRRRILHQNEQRPAARAILVIGWSGMRGVLALAAAMSLPDTLANGNAFPQRNLIIFLTFSVILATLVLQGLTLPPLIRALGLAGTAGSNVEEKEARCVMLETALKHIEEQRSNASSRDLDGLYEDLAMHYRRRLAALTGQGTSQGGVDSGDYSRALEISRRLLRLERQTALRLRNEGRINDEVLRRLERELDLGEARLDAMPT